MSKLITNTIRHTGALSDSITLTTDGTCTAEITNRSNRNIIINGAMNVAQRGTSDTSTDHFSTVDRWSNTVSGLDENVTRSQESLSSSDTGPYEKGFRNAWKFVNGNQTSGAGAADYIIPQYPIEAQDLANSGWDYTDSDSKITLSFWVKSSVTQTFYAYIYTSDGTARAYSFSYDLSANTWTKVTKTIPGNSNITIDNNTGDGFRIYLPLFLGTDRTNSGNTLNTWAAYSGSNRTPDSTTTWYTTNDATWHLTGVQLEVGATATDFEHKRFNDELRACQRYYCKTYAHGTVPGTETWEDMHGRQSDGGSNSYAGPGVWYYPGGEMRAKPTCVLYSKDGDTGKINIDNAEGPGTMPAVHQGTKGMIAYRDNDSTGSSGAGNNIAFHATANAEL